MYTYFFSFFQGEVRMMGGLESEGKKIAQIPKK